MKKLLVIALTTIVAAAFALPASAVENEFGGYWRTRAYNQVDFDGTESGSSAVVDTRTRIYYTAKFSDAFKFVNKFEFNAQWGDNNGGDIGADGDTYRVKNSYADFNTGAMNFKVGIQPAVIGRAFLFDDDFSGATATFNSGKNSFSAIWMKVDEENATITTQDLAYLDQDGDSNPDDLNGDGIVNEADQVHINSTTSTPQAETDQYALTAKLNISDAVCISPFLVLAKQEATETAVYYVGADAEFKFGAASLWTTLIVETGEIASVDSSAYLFAFGGNAGIVHGQMFYATGDDDAADDELNNFIGAAGQCYYWSEIMGYGTFDNQVTPGSCAGAVSNIMAANIGVTVKPMDKLTINVDLWYAQLAEDNAAGDADLGVELDLKATYAILDNLNLDLVAAYQSAGDAVAGTDSEDPMEFGTRLSFSF